MYMYRAYYVLKNGYAFNFIGEDFKREYKTIEKLRQEILKDHNPQVVKYIIEKIYIEEVQTITKR